MKAILCCLLTAALAGHTQISAPSKPNNAARSPARHFLDVRQKYPKLAERPFGKGVFAHTRRSGNVNPATPEEINRFAGHPFISGTQLAYSWEELEPRPNEYQWAAIEADMHPWATHGKKVWIEISTANKRDVGPDRLKGSPAWIFEHGVPQVAAEGTAPYPVFWHPRYLQLWAEFIHAFAAHFDGDPRIEFVSTGGYSGGSEPSLSQDDNEILMEQWTRYGFDGFTPTGVYLNRAIKPILSIYDESFRRTPVAQVIHTKSDFDDAMNRFVADRRFIMLSNGFSYAKLNAKVRREWRSRRETYGVRTGFAEWGPLGRSLEKVRRNKDPLTKAKLMDCYQSAIGSDRDSAFEPASRLSYLPLSDRIVEIETEAEWTAAIRWAVANLE